MSIGNQFARNVVMEEYANKDPFWFSQKHNIDFEELNKVRTPSQQEIQAFQRKKIQEFSNVAMKKFEGLDAVTSDSFSRLFSSFESEEDAELDKLLERLYTGFNSLYYYKVDKDKRSEKEWNDIQRRLQNIIDRLEKLLIKLGGDIPVVLQNDLILFKQAAQSAGLNLDSEGAIKDFLTHINQIKGDALEELGVMWIKKLQVPNIASIRLGSVFLDTEDKSKRGQLIQDLIAYSVKSPSILENKMVEYRKTGEEGYTQISLKKLFEIIEEANGKNETIHITDKTYDVITGLDSLNIQAKSGKNQRPWNINKRTSVSINEISDELGVLELGINRTFQLLKSLNDLDKNIEPWILQDTSQEYQALANYGLATVMNKVLHLSERGNQYLLTPFGFMTYPARVAQLFKTEEHIAELRGTVNLKNDLGTSYGVGIS